jgi:hypothetical protein
LNIIERKRWVRSYLGCYLGLVDDDRRYILEDDPLPCYLITWVEQLIYLHAVSLERLEILLHQGVKCRFDDVVLVEVGSIDTGASFLHA